MAPEQSSPLRAAFRPPALRAAMTVQRPVFANPWDSPEDMFACYTAVSLLDPFLLWAGGKLMGAIFGFSSHWPIGVYMIAALVGAAGFMTIVGRQRTSRSVDVLAIGTWLVLGLIVAPTIGLAPATAVAVIVYAILMVGVLGYVLLYGRFAISFLHTISWPVIWSLLGIFFAWAAYHCLFFQ